MSDLSRTDGARARDAETETDRDAKIEQLLLAGLDHYFAAQYDQAINVWTRVLFLDRTHARAHAYVERARSALAERQRASDQLLQTGVAAFERGEGGEARRLLQAAIDGGAPSDEALAILDRLNRLDSGAGESPRVRHGREARQVAARASASPSRVPWAGWTALAAMVVAIGLASAWAWSRGYLDPGSQDRLVATPGPAQVAEPELPLPTRGEVALARARALVTAGHLREALTALDGVRSTDSEKADADALGGEIQRQLLAPPPDTAQPVPPDRPTGGSRNP